MDHAGAGRVAAAVGARAVVVPETGHSPAADDPHGTAAALDGLLTSFA